LVNEKKLAANKFKRFFFAVIILKGLIFSLAWGQDEPLVRTLVESADLKKLTKADQFSNEADDLMEEVNRLNMQALSLQGDSGQREEVITKKSNQLETQALQKQVEASALYEKCNELKFIVYRKYLDKFWEKNPGAESTHTNEKLLEEQANDNYFQAASYRIDAKRMDTGSPKVEKLTEANNLESEAIHKVITSLALCYGLQQPAITVPAGKDTDQTALIQPDRDISPSVTREIPDEDSISANLVINQDMIDMYNRYISEGQYTDTSLSTGNLAGITSFDSDRILQLWYEYIYGRSGQESDVDLPGADQEKNMAVTVQAQHKPKPPEQKDTEIGIVTDENRDKLIPADEEIIYRVQIAAHRTELTQRALSRIYYGNKNVDMVNENGWFKYSVGDFSTYEEADKFRKSSGIGNAFVVAYRNSKEVGPETVVTARDSAKINVPAGVQIMPPGLIFRIQIAACHVPVTVAQLKRMYNGSYPVEMVYEDGWYKYQFMGVRLYSDATRMIRDVNLKGVFIVAYNNGVKQNLAQSVNNNRVLERELQAHDRKGTPQDIEFHVQLGTSRMLIREEKLTSLYSGPEQISIIVEDGWFKYHLKAGNSLEMAQSLKKKCGIDKAFIVAYRQAAKIGLYEALKEAK
jgi:hypothetical protein